LKSRAEWVGFCAALAAGFSATASADVIAIQCTIDDYRSSFAPRPDSFMVLVDTQARTVTTYYGMIPLRITRRELLGAGPGSEGWQSNLEINRNTGKLKAGTDKVDGRKYSFTVLSGMCILPESLRGPKYKASTDS